MSRRAHRAIRSRLRRRRPLRPPRDQSPGRRAGEDGVFATGLIDWTVASCRGYTSSRRAPRSRSAAYPYGDGTETSGQPSNRWSFSSSARRYPAGNRPSDDPSGAPPAARRTATHRRGFTRRQHSGQQRTQTITHSAGAIGRRRRGEPPKSQHRMRLRIRRVIHWVIAEGLSRRVQESRNSSACPAAQSRPPLPEATFRETVSRVRKASWSVSGSVSETPAPMGTADTADSGKASAASVGKPSAKPPALL